MGSSTTPEERAAAALRADGIDHDEPGLPWVERYHTGGGIFVAAVWLTEDRQDGPYIWVSDATDWDGGEQGRFLIGAYPSDEAAQSGDLKYMTIADTESGMVEVVRAAINDLCGSEAS